ncbi:MAG TPA: hypothetical protein VGP46_00045 [Acidimicrobiales bacterium]|jgi:hypothetical protein|nr:hypothetical protein [Acidimicrobiales bacterium]
MSTQSGCQWFEEIAAEFALGSLNGAERSSAIAHLEVCDDCQALVKSLSTAADALLLIAPEIDPPAGFEVRLLERRRRALGDVVPAGAKSDVVATGARPDVMQSSSGPDVMAAGAQPDIMRSGSRPYAMRSAAKPDVMHKSNVVPLRRRSPTWLQAAAVALVLAVGGVAVGAGVSSHNSRQSTSSIRLASLQGVGSSYDHAVGAVAITNGNPGLVLMTFDKTGWSGWVDCVVVEHGRSKTVGSFYVQDGYGSWSVHLSTPGAAVTSARLDTMTGDVLAIANFT